MEKSIYKIAILFVLVACLASCGPDEKKIDHYKDTVKAILNGNTIELSRGLKVQLLGIAPGYEATSTFMTNNNLVGKQVELMADKGKNSKKTYTKSNATVQAYVFVNPGTSDKYCLNGQILRQCARSEHAIYSEAHVTDSLEVWRALFDGCHHEKLPDIALYMKQRTFLVLTPDGLGTGFFINENGLAITNHHVLPKEYEGEARIYLYSKSSDDTKIHQEYERNVKKILYYSDESDKDITIFAVDLLDGEKVPYFHLAKEQAPEGTHVQTMGNPGGSYGTLYTANYSQGAISSYMTGNQFDWTFDLSPDAQIVTFDIPVNPGNSGGPVALDNGLVVAVVRHGESRKAGLNGGINILQVREMLDRINADYECK